MAEDIEEFEERLMAFHEAGAGKQPGLQLE
jgi:hypothetical protein